MSTPIDNRSAAINVLRFWYDASGLQSWVSLSDGFPTAIDHLDAMSPSFLENFGAAARLTSQDKQKSAMQRLAADNYGSYPSIPEFGQYLAADAGVFNSKDLSLAARDTAEGIAKGFLFGGPLLIMLAVVAGVGIFAMQSGGINGLVSKLKSRVRAPA